MSSRPGTAVRTDVIRTIPPDLHRARLLQGRLDEALSGLGLGGSVPSRWVTPACSGWYFSPFNHHQAGRLVTALEELVTRLHEVGVDEAGEGAAAVDQDLRTGSCPGPDQQTFEFGSAA
jgi:hypothetical protein